MNDQDNKLDDTLLDRLVDGEMPEAEYRNAIGIVESHPDGWRRCALAFLEAQAWGREFCAVRHESPAKSRPTSQVDTRGSYRWSGLYFGGMAVACAASFLLAFGIAMQLQNGWMSPFSSNSTDPVARSSASSPEGNPSIQYASQSNGPNQALENAPVGRYQLVVDGESGAPQAVEMPVFSADDPRAALLLDDYATMPHDIIRALQKNGNEVQRRRNWIPMRGATGAPMYVPVDELQITPVSNRSFQ